MQRIRIKERLDDGGWGHELRNADHLKKLAKKGNSCYSDAFRESTVLMIF